MKKAEYVAVLVFLSVTACAKSQTTDTQEVSGGEISKLNGQAVKVAQAYHYDEIEGDWEKAYRILSSALKQRFASPEQMRALAKQVDPAWSLQAGEHFADRASGVGNYRDGSLFVVTLFAEKESGAPRFLRRVIVILEDGKWRVLHSFPTRLQLTFDQALLGTLHQGLQK